MAMSGIASRIVEGIVVGALGFGLGVMWFGKEEHKDAGIVAVALAVVILLIWAIQRRTAVQQV